MTEEAHIQSKKNIPLTKQLWSEWMDQFAQGGQINKTDTGAFQFQPVAPEESMDDLDEAVDPLDSTELQNYLCAIGKWRPESILEFKRKELIETLTQESVLFPPYYEPFNNAILGTVVKSLTESVYKDDLSKITQDLDSRR